VEVAKCCSKIKIVIREGRSKRVGVKKKERGGAVGNEKTQGLCSQLMGETNQLMGGGKAAN